VSGFDRHCLTKDHTRCSQDACIANNLDESTYETRHASVGCCCAHMGQESETSALIAGMLQSASIPVIQVSLPTDDSGGDLVISVEKSTRAPYVAISHVWSDGLGNPRDNTLPKCQLRRLQSYVDSLYPESSSRPVPFWIDTICVPGQTDLRRTAIWLMAQTYKAADKVLVIDDWLTQTGFNGNGSLDLLKLKSCTWTERLWTLQESILTQTHQLYFQTPQGPIAEDQIYGDFTLHQGARFMANLIGSDSDSLQEAHPDAANAMIRAVERIQDIYTKFLEHLQGDDDTDSDPIFPWKGDHRILNLVDSWFAHGFVWVEGRDYFSEMRWPGGRKPNEVPVTEANAVLIIGDCMRFRSTSRIEDELICLATLLGQDLKDLLGEPSVEERMKLVVSKIRHVPAGILFSPRPRIDVDGFRWAPLSFRAATVGKAYSPGVSFTTVAQVRPEGLLARLDGIVLELHDSFKVGSEFLVSMGPDRLPVRMRGQITYAGGGVGNALALIVWGSSAVWPRTRSDAVLVEIQRMEEDIVFTRLRAHYFMGPSVQEETNSVRIIPGRIMQKQQWCVG